MEEVSLPPALMEFVEAQMASFKCAAHSMDHVHRVLHMALRLAREEDGGCNMKVVCVAALLHDCLDSKLLAESAAAGVEQALLQQLRSTTNGKEGSCFLNEIEIEQVLFIVKNIGYRRLLDAAWDVSKQSLELRCVQDADLLDAIGSTGVARCYAFGGARNRGLFDLGEVVIGRTDLTPAIYAVSKGSGLEHFFEKLLRIPDMMTTAAGARLAVPRKRRMLEFIRGWQEEAAEGGTGAEYEQVLRLNLAAFG